MKELIFLEPVFKETIWGGEKLKTEFGYEIPSSHTGECWAVSAHKTGDCKLLDGSYKGNTLSWLWDSHRELFGGMEGEEFPLLIKIIDAQDDLSIQVHPDDAYAKENENGSLGKTECWYILDADPGATIVVGHNAASKEELVQMIEEEKWMDLIKIRPLNKGDFFQINPGTVHAIRGGSLILETQQSSDVTYRLYDYGRLQDGKPRQLHIQKSIDVIVNPYEDVKTSSEKMTGEGYEKEHLITCPYYCVDKYMINGEAHLVQNEPFLILSVLKGAGRIDGANIKKGDHFIIPAGYGEYVLEGEMEVISSSPGQANIK